MQSRWNDADVYTIGHSTRTLEEFVEVLRANGVQVLADIRTVPRSRRNPQFNSDSLPYSLAACGIRYAHIARLGGLRRARKDSPNQGWRNASFRGFADHMQTADFEQGLDELHGLAEHGTVALMCAEAVPWRCHRSMVADALTVRGAHVRHIVGTATPRAHRLTSFARVDTTRITYPGTAEPEWLALPTAAPFHLEATARVLQRRPTNLVERWEGARYEHVFRTEQGLVLAVVENRGTVDTPEVRFATFGATPSSASRALIEQALRRMLGLDIDPTPLLGAAQRVPSLRPTIEALRGMRPPRFAGMFDIFANVVPFQQLSLDAGVAIFTRLVERFGEETTIAESTYAVMPTATAVAHARLPSLVNCGLSRAKAESLRALAKLIAAGDLTEEAIAALDTPTALKTLIALPGIGPWSAAIVLLRGFGRLDVFPPGDSGAQRGLTALLRLRAPGALERVTERFGAYRGYLYFCGLGANLLAKGLIRPANAVHSVAPREPAAE